MNIDYFRYLGKALHIYEGMHDTSKVLAKGLEPHHMLWKPHGGIFIALRHPREVGAMFAERSAKINERIPTMSYTAEKLHTSYPTTPQILEFERDNDALEAVCRGVRSTVLVQPMISYFGLRLTPDAVITAGIPDEQFYEGAHVVKAHVLDALKDINESRMKEGKKAYEFNLGFGPHMTINRWLKPAKADEIRELGLLDLLAPIQVESKPTSLAVGYWRTDFNLTPPRRDWEIVEEFTFS